jgi:predicted phosphohydrolase
VQNSVQRFGKVAIGGVRLWDDRELDFDRVINYKPNPKKNLDQALTADENEAIFQKELIRLEAVLQAFHPEETKILMCHYPPIGLDLESSRAGKLIEHYGVDICVFGHLHQLNTHAPLFGRRGKTNYQLTSCDYLDFTPQLILELPA